MVWAGMHFSNFLPLNDGISVDAYFIIYTVYYILSNVIMSRVYRTKTVGYTLHYTFVTKFISLPNIISTDEH